MGYDRDYGLPGQIAPTGVPHNLAATALVANTAYAARFVPSRDMTVTKVSFAVTTGTGNNSHLADIGIYEASAGTKVGVAFGTGESQATLTTNLAGLNNDLIYGARPENPTYEIPSLYGYVGNAISIEYINPGAANQSLAYREEGMRVIFTLATDGDSVITSTAQEIYDKWAADSDLSTVIEMTDPTSNPGDGSGVVTAMARTHLSGGGDQSPGPQAGEIDDAAIGTINVKRSDLTPVALQADTVYCIAIATNNTPTLECASWSDVLSTQLYGTAPPEVFALKQASSYPLPATLSSITTATTFCPILALRED